MTSSVVLAECRRGKVVVLERINSKCDDKYRVTVSRRFSSLASAQSAFLSDTPPGMAQKFKKQISENNKSSLMR